MFFSPFSRLRFLWNLYFPKPYNPLSWEDYCKLEGFLSDPDWKDTKGGHNDSLELEGKDRE